MEPERRRALDWLRERGQALEREVDLLYNPPGAPFTHRFGLPPRWWVKAAGRLGQPFVPQVETHPELSAPLPPLDLAGVTPGQRRAVIALLSSPTGCTYAEAADALGIHVGSLHRHLGRLRARRPALYAAVMAHRAARGAIRGNYKRRRQLRNERGDPWPERRNADNLARSSASRRPGSLLRLVSFRHHA